MIPYRQYLSAAPCHCPQHVIVWSCRPVSVRCWPAHSPGWLHRAWCISLHLWASLPPISHHGREPPQKPSRLYERCSIRFFILVIATDPWRGRFALSFGEFQKHLWNATHHSIFYSPNWDIFTRFSIEKKLDCLGFEFKTSTRRLNSSIQESSKRWS